MNFLGISILYRVCRKKTTHKWNYHKSVKNTSIFKKTSMGSPDMFSDTFPESFGKILKICLFIGIWSSKIKNWSEHRWKRYKLENWRIIKTEHLVQCLWFCRTMLIKVWMHLQRYADFPQLTYENPSMMKRLYTHYMLANIIYLVLGHYYLSILYNSTTVLAY